MPEYRRFIAYFYEYIDGKKQKNAGFAKVELRNGMWRILFRLNTETEPLRPVQAYGFVREQGWQLGLYMGSMRPGMVRMEEWAYHADAPVWDGKYGFASLAGIWIQSEDGRRYVTVWDDEPIFADRFVLALPREAGDTENKEEPERIAGREKESAYGKPEEDYDSVGKEGVNEHAQPEGDSVNPGREDGLNGRAQTEKDNADSVENLKKNGSERQTHAVGEMQAAEVSEVWEEKESRDSNVEDDRGEIALDDKTDEDMSEVVEQESDGVRSASKVVEQESDRGISLSGTMEQVADRAKSTSETVKADRVTSTNGIAGHVNENQPVKNMGEAEAAAEACEALEQEIPVQAESHAYQPSEQEQTLAMLFANRPALEPFSDAEFRECVQLRPCDLVRLQQANCRVGRNTFLQHGFYQYHHLLLAKDQEGHCILGVPGVVNAQERYMAGMFSFDRFKPANGYDRGRQFGYWCKEI